MNEFVVDSSVLIAVVSSRESPAAMLRDRVAASMCHAPHLLDAEVGNALRRLTLAGAITEDTALTGLRVTRHLVDERYPHEGPLAEAAWQLRGATTFYDALYVALATRLRLPLLTLDGRLSRSPGLPCRVELVG